MSKFTSVSGIWKVTTPGDCEGRTIIDLGTYTGNIDEIALHLADKGTDLTFTPIDPEKWNDRTPVRKTVHVSMSNLVNSDYGNKSKFMPQIRELFKDRPVKIGESNYYGSFTITTDNETIDDKRNKLLAKLTLEEKRLLGLI